MSETALSAGPIRLALAGVPGLLASMVRRSVQGQSDMVIVDELRDADGVTDLARNQPVDVVVTARTRNGVPMPCQQQLFGITSTPVIVVGPDGRLDVYDRRVLREAALDDLLGEIRRVAARGVRSNRS